MVIDKTKKLDWGVMAILAVGAGCGLIYEYLLAHYAGRVVGAMESTIFGIITLMMVSMGAGSFLARKVKNPYLGFAVLEVVLAFVGSVSVLLIGGVFALVNLFPAMLAETFQIPIDLVPAGGLIAAGETIASVSPFAVAALLGVLIGMEIPLIGEIRADIYKQAAANNMGSIYGVDYIGAGVGATIFVLAMLSMEVSISGAITASVNLLLGFTFLVMFADKIPRKGTLLAAHALVAVVILNVFENGRDWGYQMEDLLYKDEVVYRVNTDRQRLVITERTANPRLEPVLTFYINGRTQFASNDEHIYHSMLVYPAMAASARHERVLIIGGGDGLALRDVLKWKPEQVLLLDLDEKLVKLFRDPMVEDGEVVNQRLIDANEGSFSHSVVETRFGDAFLSIDKLLQSEEVFDTIIVDLPDPSHPDLNKLYSSRFYAKLHTLLAGDGAMVVQSTSPYHAKNTFISTGKTVEHAGFMHVDQYHANVPSFGEWGWTIATKNGRSPLSRLSSLKKMPVDDGWATKGNLLAAFEFGKGFFDEADSIEVNRLGSMVAYQYHLNDWNKEVGLIGR